MTDYLSFDGIPGPIKNSPIGSAFESVSMQFSPPQTTAVPGISPRIVTATIPLSSQKIPLILPGTKVTKAIWLVTDKKNGKTLTYMWAGVEIISVSSSVESNKPSEIIKFTYKSMSMNLGMMSSSPPPGASSKPPGWTITNKSPT